MEIPTKKFADTLKRELSPNKVLYAPATFTLWAGVAYLAYSPTPLRADDIGEYSLHPQPFHAVSLALHLINVLLVFLLLRVLLGHDWAAAGGALVFAIHPVQVEPVAWISATNNLLSGAFSLLALWQYLVWRQTRSATPTERFGWLRYVFATICFALALLSKPSAATLPIIALILAIWQSSHESRAEWRKIIFSLLPWLAMAAAILLVVRSVQQELAPDAITALWQRPFIAGDALAFYLWKVLVPLNYISHYGRTPQWVMSHWWGYVNWLGPAFLALLIWQLHRKLQNAFSRALVGGALIFLVTVSPMLGFVPYYFHSISIVADRYLYFSMLGPALALAGALTCCFNLRQPTQAKRIILTLCGLWFLLLGYQTYRQTAYWQSSNTLWSHLLQVNPSSSAAYAQLGAEQIEKENWGRAESYYRLAAQYVSRGSVRDAARIQTSLGDIAAHQGQLNEASEHYRRALEIAPQSVATYVQWGNMLREAGQEEQSAALYRRALQVSSRAPTAHYNLALVLSRQDKQAEAEQHLRAALEFRPDDAETHNALALALVRQGRTEAAIQEWKIALQNDPALADAHTNLGTALAMQGQVNAAIEHWQEALRLAPGVAQTHFNLGMAFYQQGKRTQAIEAWKEALRLDPSHEGAKNALAQMKR